MKLKLLPNNMKHYFCLFFDPTPTQDPLRLSEKPARTWTLDVDPELLSYTSSQGPRQLKS